MGMGLVYRVFDWGGGECGRADVYLHSRDRLTEVGSIVVDCHIEFGGVLAVFFVDWLNIGNPKAHADGDPLDL